MENKLTQEFEEYMKKYNMNDKMIYLKYYHSYKVKELMEKLAKKLKLSEKEIEVASVIGLLHDIGRFEQIRKCNSLSDLKTGMDHADEGCSYLFDLGHIKDFYDDEDYYEIIRCAIKYHNKYKIDDSVSGKSLLFSKLIRDADKIDIYRVLKENFSYVFNIDDVSPRVLESYNSQRQVDNRDINTKTDAVFSTISFLFDINFKESFEIIKNENYIDMFFSVVTPSDNSIEEFNKLKENSYLYIDKKIDTN